MIEVAMDHWSTIEVTMIEVAMDDWSTIEVNEIYIVFKGPVRSGF